MQHIIDEYLNQIGVKKLGLATDDSKLTFINEVIENHHRNFVFTNLDLLLNDCAVISLETEDLFKKIVMDRRGGYCFEQNKLLFKILEAMEFETKPCLGRVVYGKDVDVPQTHRITIVTLNEQEYLADVGFGPYAPTNLVPLNGQSIQSLNGNEYRIHKNENFIFEMQILKPHGFFTLYTFENRPCFESDFKIGNYYTNTSSESHFTKSLTISMAGRGKSTFINDGKLSEIIGHERSQKPIANYQDFRQIMERKFFIKISNQEALKIFSNWS